MFLKKFGKLPEGAEFLFNSTDLVRIDRGATEKQLIQIAKYFDGEYHDKVRVKIVKHRNTTAKVLAYLAKTNPKHFEGTLDLIIQHPLVTKEILDKLWSREDNAYLHWYFYSNYLYGYDFLWKGLHSSDGTVKERANSFLETKTSASSHDPQSYRMFLIKSLREQGFQEIDDTLPTEWLETFYQQN